VERKITRFILLQYYFTHTKTHNNFWRPDNNKKERDSRGVSTGTQPTEEASGTIRGEPDRDCRELSTDSVTEEERKQKNQKETISTGFEPMLQDGSTFRACRVNHSARIPCEISLLVMTRRSKKGSIYLMFENI
jgi:hypothetical protein